MAHPALGLFLCHAKPLGIAFENWLSDFKQHGGDIPPSEQLLGMTTMQPDTVAILGPLRFPESVAPIQRTTNVKDEA